MGAPGLSPEVRAWAEANARPDYRAEPPRLPTGTVIAAEQREIRVLARLEQPTLAVLENVLSGEECAALIEAARPRLRPSTVVDPRTGRDVVAAYRQSDGMFFQPCETPLIARIERRLAALMGVPLENGEGLQVLHYGTGAKSEPHYDFLVPSSEANKASIARSGQRVATLVAYLNDVPAGGETAFPALGLAVAPRKGNAVYFEYANARGQVDCRSLHAGAAVLAGEKWAATKWVRARRFRALSPGQAA